jgi:hypothetical protein
MAVEVALPGLQIRGKISPGILPSSELMIPCAVPSIPFIAVVKPDNLHGTPLSQDERLPLSQGGEFSLFLILDCAFQYGQTRFRGGEVDSEFR